MPDKVIPFGSSEDGRAGMTTTKKGLGTILEEYI
jgi:hypothetical protein